METNQLRVAVIEDSPDDFHLTALMVRRGHAGRSVDVRQYKTLAEGLAGLPENGGTPSLSRVDALLLDLNLPDSFGIDTVAAVIRAFPRLPVVVLTSLDDDRLGEAAVAAGAQDYMPKDGLDPVRLARSIAFAIRRKEAENMIQRAHDEARRAAELKDDMISMINHDIGSPLTAARGALVILKDKLFGPYNEQYDKYVDIAAKNVDRFSRLVCDLRDVSRYSDRGFSVDKSWTDLRECAEHAWMEVGEDAQRRGIQFSIKIADAGRISDSGAPSADVTDTGRIWADPQRLTQMLGNILRNAARFSAGRIELRADVNAQGARIEVEDDGPGFDPDDFQNLFDKFYRGRALSPSKGRLNDRRKGGGLGLAIVKLLADAHGGSAAARNGLMGACISIVLPPAESVENADARDPAPGIAGEATR